MKIQVANMSEETIEGYRHVVVSNNYINFMDISNNECVEIIASDVLDSFSLENIRDCIVSLVNKLRLGGKLIIGGKDVRLFCKHVLSGAISENEASKLIEKSTSMPSQAEIVEAIRSLGLKILSTSITGIHFQVTAQRG